MTKGAKIKLYAKALAEVILEEKVLDKKIVDNFIKILVRAGLEKKSKEILDLAQDLILFRNGGKKITLETAREVTHSQNKILESLSGKKDIVQKKIKPELIAGIKIIINDSRQFDASMQNKLQSLWMK